MRSPSPPDRLRWPLGLLTLIWAGLLLIQGLESLRWPMAHDTPLLHYAAWLVHRGHRPYVDLFEMNLPGTYALHGLMLSLFGPEGVDLRRADLTYLALTMGSAGLCLRRWGWLPALSGALSLGTLYLLGGPFDTLQRDYLMVCPLLLSLACVQGQASRVWPRLLSGMALGFAALIKPTVLLLAPALLGLRWAAARARQQDGPAPAELPAAPLIAPTGLPDLRLWLPPWREWFALSLGLAIPPLLALLWLVQRGSLEGLLWIWTHYLAPLYSQLDGAGIEWTDGAHRYRSAAREALRSLLTPTRGGLILGAGVGAALTWQMRHRDAETGRTLAGLLALLGVGFVHVVLGLKLWWYHWWPAYGAMALLLGLCARELRPLQTTPSASTPAGLSALSTLARVTLPLWGILVLAVALHAHPQLAQAEAQASLATQLAKRMEELTSPTDRVQVLDTTGGGIHAAYLARREPGSRFIYDFHFFHHQDSQTNATLRSLFLEDLERLNPKLIVIFERSWSHRMSYRDLLQFQPFLQVLSTRYLLLEERPEYRLYLRKELQ